MPLQAKVARALKGRLTARQLKLVEKANATFAMGWHRKFDYVVYYHFGKAENFEPSLLRPLHQGSFFSIFRVEKKARS